MQFKFVWTRPFDNPKENIKKMVWAAFFEGKLIQQKVSYSNGIKLLYILSNNLVV